MRLDKFIVSTGKLSRSEAGRAARSGRILVDGIPEKKADRAIDPEQNVITLDGELLTYRKFTYILMNKPDGYISASDSGREKTPSCSHCCPTSCSASAFSPAADSTSTPRG